MIRLLVVSASVVALAGPALAQGHGGGHASASAGVAATMGAGPPTSAPGADISAGRTAERGAADVLPNTQASPTGVEHGSKSTSHATAAGAKGTDSSTTTGFAASTIVKDSTGATVGRVVRSTTAADGTAQVVLRIGDDEVTVPASSLSMTGRFATTTASKADLEAKRDHKH
jgi:hypothetical protein